MFLFDSCEQMYNNTSIRAQTILLIFQFVNRKLYVVVGEGLYQERMLKLHPSIFFNPSISFNLFSYNLLQSFFLQSSSIFFLTIFFNLFSYNLLSIFFPTIFPQSPQVTWHKLSLLPPRQGVGGNPLCCLV